MSDHVTPAEENSEILPCPDAKRIEELADELRRLLDQHGLPHVVAYVIPREHESEKVSLLSVIDCDMGNDNRLLRATLGDGYAIAHGIASMVRAKKFWGEQVAPTFNPRSN